MAGPLRLLCETLSQWTLKLCGVLACHPTPETAARGFTHPPKASKSIHLDTSIYCAARRGVKRRQPVLGAIGSNSMVTVGILTVSTKGAAGQREDTSGEAIQALVTGEPLRATVAARTGVADDRASVDTRLP